MGARCILCESDSSEVVSLMSGTANISFHVYVATIGEIISLVNQDWSVNFGHVLREANVCADFMAKEAWKMTSSWKDWKDPPVLLRSLLLQDTLGAAV